MKPLRKWYFDVLGFLAFLWLVIRTGTKPSRLNYPCQRAVLPLAVGFLSSVAIPIRRVVRKRVGWYLTMGVVLSWLGVYYLNLPQKLPGKYNIWLPPDPNSPIGEGKGIFPGRVVWVYDTSATSWDGFTGYWWEEDNLSQEKVNKMVDTALLTLTGKPTIKEAWDTLFKYFNQGSPYQVPEKIAIKVNLNPSSSSHTQVDNECNGSHQVVIALLRQLIHEVGVPESCITIYESLRYLVDHFVTPIHDSFPGVWFVDRQGGGIDGKRRRKVPSETLCIFTGGPDLIYSSTDTVFHLCDTQVVEAKYLIDICVVKYHGYGWVTLFGKNHYGSLDESPHHYHEGMHDAIGEHNEIPENKWTPYYKLLSHPHLGGKTILFVADGLYGGPSWSGIPKRWASLGDDWLSSIFVSQDPVAANSVMWDFLNNEAITNPNHPPKPLNEDSQIFLHELASPDSKYGTPTPPSLGVHEHWNNAEEKKYTGIDFKTIKIGKVKVEEKEGEGIEIEIHRRGLRFKLKQNENLEIKIYNLIGRCIHSLTTEVNKGEEWIKLPQLPQGVYFLKIRMKQKGKVYKEKLVIIK